ncbi:AAA family ATPase [Rhizobium cremeum]|uniref:AAA family ATPase n=1 Tax=Rhizobium cremeum TaxID=2813827 RepID=UPI0039DF38F0
MPNFVEIEDAVAALRLARRVMVVGCSGGGKSTLSQKLAAHFGLLYISMDKEFFWLPGWIGRPRQEQRAMIAQAAEGDRWIMDGSNPSSFDLRVPRSDLIIWVRMPRRLSLWGVMARALKTYGRTRPDMAPGCPERLPDREFIRYIWNFEKVHAPRFLQNFDLHGPNVPVLVLKSRSDTRRLLDLAGVPA